MTSRFARFVAIGAVNTILGYSIFLALLLVLPYLVAYSVAYVLGIGISYLLNTRFVFRTERRWSTALRFPMVYVVQYVMSATVIYVLVERAGVRPFLATLVAIVLNVPVTYVLARTVFRRG